MSKSRNMADLLDSNGDVKSGALDNVPPSNDASALTTGTLPVDRVPYMGRRNLIINGDFQVWQRGTSGSVPYNVAYSTADRFGFWAGYGTGSTSKQTDVLNGERFNYLKFVNDGNGTNGGAIIIRQHIEDLEFLGGKTTTLSFRAKASSAMTINFYQRHSYGSGGSATESIEGTETVTLSTSWQEYSVTLPAWNTMSGKTIGDGAYALVGIQADDRVAFTLDITNIQLEVGSVATPFEHRSYGEELALCQRYYYQIGSSTTALNRFGIMGEATSSTSAQYNLLFPTPLRAGPSLIYNDNGGTTYVYSANSGYTATLVGLGNTMYNENGDAVAARFYMGGFSSLPAGNACQAYNQSIGSTLAFDAEL
jgi:hypothetical protein